MVCPQPEERPARVSGRLYAFLVTITLWAYFTLGFVLFFLPLYLAAWLFSRDREQSCQRLNSLFFRIFLLLVRVLVPSHRWRIDDRLATSRSSVIVCNHVSYLDPLILIALCKRQKTIVKSRFFQIPLFGWFLKTAGYLPSTVEGKFSRMMIEQMEHMDTFLQSGGNLFVFPEGTRSRDGQLGDFNRGAFKIARICRAPIKAVTIRNSDKLYTPGTFVFNTGIRNTITVSLAGEVAPDYEHQPPTAAELEHQIRSILTADENCH